MKYWTWALGMAGAGIVGWLAWSSAPTAIGAAAKPPDRARVDPALASVQSTLEQVSRRLALLELRERNAATLGRVSKAAEPAPAPVEADPAVEEREPPGAELTREEREQRVERKARRAEAGMERILTEQAPDKTWEREAARAAEASFAQLALAGSSLAAVHCGESVCRVSVRHDGEAARQEFMTSQALLRPPFNTELFGRYDAETGETQVYLARHGEKLPDIADEMSVD